MILLRIVRRSVGTNYTILSRNPSSVTVQSKGREYALRPLSAKYLENNDIDLSKIIGSSEGGKISIYDIQNYLHPKTFRRFNDVVLEDKKLNLDHYRSTLNPLIEPHKGEDIVETNLDKMEQHVKIDNYSKIDETLQFQNEFENPKSNIPHYTLTKSINVTHAIEFVQQIKAKYPNINISLVDIILKVVHLASLDNPTFYQYYWDQNLYKSNVLFARYVNHFDPTQNRTLRMNRIKNLKQYRESNYEFKYNVSTFLIEDSGLYPLSELKPIITKNNVS